jgi:hypothetical protein
MPSQSPSRGEVGSGGFKLNRRSGLRSLWLNDGERFIEGRCYSFGAPVCDRQQATPCRTGCGKIRRVVGKGRCSGSQSRGPERWSATRSRPRHVERGAVGLGALLGRDVAAAHRAAVRGGREPHFCVREPLSEALTDIWTGPNLLRLTAMFARKSFWNQGQSSIEISGVQRRETACSKMFKDF